MSTLATADLGSDDSDTDYLPAYARLRQKRAASSSSGSAGSDAEARALAREVDALRAEKESAEAAERKRKAEETLRLMQADEVAPPPRPVPPPAVVPKVEGMQATTVGATAPSTAPAAGEASSSTALPAPAAPVGKRKGPVRKKPRASLEGMAAALDKGKKMTTLEKSQLDWAAHTAADQARADELAANRRSGGALGRHDFLGRVAERREETYEAQRSGRRG